MVIANAAGHSLEEYCAVAERLGDSTVDMVELNISCPNVKEGGVNFGTSCDSVARVTAEVKKRCGKPLMVKLTPNVTNIGDIAAAAESAGADALSLINTITGMRIDVKTPPADSQEQHWRLIRPGGFPSGGTDGARGVQAGKCADSRYGRHLQLRGRGGNDDGRRRGCSSGHGQFS